MAVLNETEGHVSPEGADIVGTQDLNVCVAELDGPLADPENPGHGGSTEWGEQPTWTCPERGRLFVDDTGKAWWARDLVPPGEPLGEGPTPEPVSLDFEALPALVHAAREVVSRWERGDLAGAVRELDDALRAFGDHPGGPVPGGSLVPEEGGGHA